MTYRDTARKLRALGCVELRDRGRGSHRVWHNPPLDRLATLPFHAGRDIALGTLRAAIRALGLEWAAFQQA